MKCVKDLEGWLKSEYGVADLAVDYQPTPPKIEGDVTINCFRFADALKAKPFDVAARVRDWLAGHDDVTDAVCEKAFVNVTLRPETVFRATFKLAETLHKEIQLPEAERRRILIEFPAPNTNKPLHLGHVRNIALGAAVSGILGKAGHTVIPVNLVNDRGIHICKSMIAYERWGEEREPDPAKREEKGDHFVGDFYVRYNTELKKQTEALRASAPALEKESDEALFGRTEIGAATQEMLKQWEAGDPEVRALWERMSDWAMSGFDQTFARLDIAFEEVYRESDTYKEGRKIVEQGLADGIFTRRDDDAVDVDLETEKLDRKILLRSDGTSVYITQDLGTTLMKQDRFQPDRQVWVVGDEQIHHFKVLFAVLKKLGYKWADNLHHLAYGMVDLPTGKMKSREGTVVDADDLLDEMEKMARQACLDRLEEGEEPPGDLEDRARIIGHGALRFWLLKFKAKSRIQFDPAASLSFEGDTGPYIQYACARISSIIRKAGKGNMFLSGAWGGIDSQEERNLALQCNEYGKRLQKAAEDLDPSVLADYLLSLAKEFSRFYRSCPVLKAEKENQRNARIYLCWSVLLILRDGLGALGIEALESM